jgi:hypothetical protein
MRRADPEASVLFAGMPTAGLPAKDIRGMTCPYCAHDVPAAKFPWQFQRHDIYGKAIGAQATSTCIGSRNIYTLHLLGLRDLEPELVPMMASTAK